MVEKNRKLQNQFEAEASTSSHGGSGSVKPIFDGVSIFVDGFTVPSSQLALIWDQALGKFVLQTGQMKSRLSYKLAYSKKGYVLFRMRVQVILS
ncbi:DNA repair protein REV1-like isoform X3 [Quercus robur]|uniref:DNA repair protein REV1-like isoform X3 n=1 Tax=Quercus robur TaxID=38942 RepID=UPI002163522E|nr:DNA repair protein REV1-like isoform X3 [Quercus robur]XP_050261822.1 DNA repair protein REV1-like isoform X3 [Quercus robur]